MKYVLDICGLSITLNVFEHFCHLLFWLGLPVSTGSELSVSHLVTAQGTAVVSDAHLLQQSQASVSASHTQGRVMTKQKIRASVQLHVWVVGKDKALFEKE